MTQIMRADIHNAIATGADAEKIAFALYCHKYGVSPEDAEDIIADLLNGIVKSIQPITQYLNTMI